MALRGGTKKATSKHPSNPTDTDKRMFFRNKFKLTMMLKGSDGSTPSQLAALYSGGRRLSYGHAPKKIFLSLFLAVSLSSCAAINKIGSDFDELAKGLRGLDTNPKLEFFGGVASDEPNATLAGRDALIAGGNAVDAATATYFALAVTMPSTAGLGGGGVCVVHDAPSNKTLALDFLSRSSAAAGTAKRRPNALPGNVRGLFALHARYGSLPWAQLVGPAEGMARFGTRVSRAFAHDLTKIGGALLADPRARQVFGRDGGGLLREGDTITQLDLANTLSGIRTDGVDTMYKGAGAERFAQIITAAGGGLSSQELIDFRPVWRNTIELPLGDISIHFAPPPAAGGAIAAETWAMLTDQRRYTNAPADERPHLLAEAAMRAYASQAGRYATDGAGAVGVDKIASPDRIRALMRTYQPDHHTPAETLDPAPQKMDDDPSAATFVTVDANGSAVACALSMNGLFGNGIIAGDSGVLLASVPGNGGRGPASLGPVVAVDHFTNDFFFAAAAAGGATAPISLVEVALQNLLSVDSLEKAVAAKRIHQGGLPDVVFYEQGYDEGAIQSLLKRGHRVAATPTIGRVNAIGCTKGLPFEPASCEAVSDPRGFGLGAMVND